MSCYLLAHGVLASTVEWSVYVLAETNTESFVLSHPPCCLLDLGLDSRDTAAQLFACFKRNVLFAFSAPHPPNRTHCKQRLSIAPIPLGGHSASSLPLLSRPNSRAAMGSGLGGANGSSSSDVLAGEGSASPATAATGGADAGGGRRDKPTSAESTNAFFYRRSAGDGSSVGDAGTRGGRVPLQGNRSLLLPKSTMAAHNGRLLVEYQWGIGRY